MVAAKIFGGAVHHQIDAMRQGALIIGGGKSIVTEGENVAGPGQIGNDLQIRQLHGRVGRCFDQQQLGFRTQGVGEGGDIGLVNQGGRHTKTGQNFGQQLGRPHIVVALGDNVIAALHQRQNRRRNRAHAGASDESRFGPLQLGDDRFGPF